MRGRTQCQDLVITEGEDLRVAPLRVRGVDAVLEFEINRTELARRGPENHGVASLDTYNVLKEIPIGAAQPETAFSSYEWRLLRRARWAVSFEIASNGGATVTRHARPPISVKRANIFGSSWMAALKRASRFAPYCERRIVLPRIPDDEMHLALEASYLGVGVAVQTGAGGQAGSLEDIVPAAPFLAMKLTGAAWKFAETVYDQSHLGMTVVPPRRSPSGPAPRV
ncbi:hypothetical protein [Arthrobacter oryzae]|uniref:hypothetical protein n=1 Tax=Arthrobacter oryzae TaxID=409290 RepID=UPI00285FE2E9|nr:hypothetical protein [Arthrobacter oryzae]MDR6508051.1 hypothetical protein [Arthrobacter oryzae]